MVVKCTISTLLHLFCSFTMHLNCGTDHLWWVLLCTELRNATFLPTPSSREPTAGLKSFAMVFSTPAVANQWHLTHEEGNNTLQCAPHESHVCSLDSENLHHRDFNADACA